MNKTGGIIMYAKKRKRRGFHGTDIMIFAFTLLMIATSFSVSAGGTQEKQEVSKKLVVWMPSYIEAAVNFIRDSSAKAFPENELEIMPYPMETYNVKMSAALAAGAEVPDVMISHERYLPKLIAGGVLDITDRIQPVLKDLVPSSLGPITDENGRIYGLPFELTFTAFFYREDIYKEVGIEPPNTLDEFIQNGKKLKAQGKYSTGEDLQNDPINLIENLFLKYGGNFYDNTGKLIVDKPEGKGFEVAAMFKKIVDAGIVWDGEWQSPSWWDGFTSGEIASYMFLSWYPKRMRVTINDESVPGYGKWRLDQSPAVGTGYPKISIWGDVCALINKSSRNIDLSWNYIKFLTLEEEFSTDIMNRFAILSGSIPNLNKVMQTADPWPLFGGQRITGMEAEMLMKAENYMNFHPAYMETRILLAEQFVEIPAGKKTPERAIEDAVEKIKQALQKY